MANLNSELQKIYKPYYEELKKRANELPDETSCPLLMHVFDEYEQSKVKILIVGKETNSWENLKASLRLEDIIEKYQEFELGHGYIPKNGKKRTLCSPFWNFSRKFYTKSNNVSERKKKGFLWTNISKFDTGHGSRTPENIHRFKEGFELLRIEVKIIKPDVVLFFTGNDYNVNIENDLNLSFEIVDSKLNIVQLKDPLNIFPKNTYKIYHPNFLYRNKNISHEEVSNKILSLL